MPSSSSLASRVTSTVLSAATVSADDLRWAADPASLAPSLPVSPCGPIELAALGEALGLGSAAQLLSGFSLLAGESQESPWVISIPEELVQALAAVDPEQGHSGQGRAGHGRAGECSPGDGDMQEPDRLARLARCLDDSDPSEQAQLGGVPRGRSGGAEATVLRRLVTFFGREPGPFVLYLHVRPAGAAAAG